MPVENKKSTAITNADATPAVLTKRSIAGGPVFIATGFFAVAAADDDASTFRVARLPSNAVVHSIRIFATAMTGSSSWDVGVYRSAEDGGAVVDADLFASAVDISAGVNGLEVRFEAGTTGLLTLAEAELWRLIDAGPATLTADPNLQYDIVLTANTIGSAAGTVMAQILYSV